ncbi:MAG: RDD family protein, partial [Chitinophagales bacterium]
LRRLVAFAIDTLMVTIFVCSYLFISLGKSPAEFNASGDEGRPSLMDKYQFFAYFEPIALDSNRDVYFKNFTRNHKSKAAIAFILMPLLYFVFFEGLWGATIGKLMTGLRVRRTDGRKINFGIAFLRHLGRILSSMLFMLGFVLAFFDKHRQTLHDKIARTVVTKSNNENFEYQESTSSDNQLSNAM